MKITVIIYSRDAETVWNAFRFAVTSLIYENEVSVFLLGAGVEAPTLSTLKYDIQEQIDLFKENGGYMMGCGICCESRRDTMPLLEEQLDCETGSMQNMYSLVAEADKVITF